MNLTVVTRVFFLTVPPMPCRVECGAIPATDHNQVEEEYAAIRAEEATGGMCWRLIPV